MDNSFDLDNNTPVKMSTLAGVMQQLYIGSEYKVEAELDYNAKYKTYQYKPISIIAVTPKTEQQQKAFLEAIVTPAQAETLLKAYPNIVEDVINKKDNVDVSKLKGIGTISWNKIRESIINNYVISDILILLQPLGVTFNMIKKLVQSEPNPALLKQELIDNPYILTRVRGLGFKRVDDLAVKLNPDIKVSSKRTYAFIKYYLNQVGEEEGHAWVEEHKLVAAAKDSIPECNDLVKKTLETERSTEVLLHFDGDKVGLKSAYEMETGLFDILNGINEFQVDWDLDIPKGIALAEKQQGFKYTDEQKEIIERAVKNNVSIISGSAGTGKTSISRGIINVYKTGNKSIACCALSAKAAQRITEATGHPSSTIHRLLGWNRLGFIHNHDNPLTEDVIFVDEASMINAKLFYDLVQAVKEGSRIVISGDNRQLPPIGSGNIFSDLLDKSECFNVNKLTKVLRQAEQSGILHDANKIREGQNPIKSPDLKVVSGELQDMVYMFRDDPEALRNIAIKTYLKAIQTDGQDNVVIITPRKQKCTNSTLEINHIIVNQLFTDGREFIKYGEKEFCIGAKVIQRENNYDKNVFNGEIGYITDIFNSGEKDKTKLIKIQYKLNDDVKEIVYTRSELSQIDLAYALTVHLSQGSGYNTVIALIDTSHYILLDSCLLYTAMTRAKKRCLLLANPQSFIRCVNMNKSIVRQTWLSVM